MLVFFFYKYHKRHGSRIKYPLSGLKPLKYLFQRQENQKQLTISDEYHFAGPDTRSIQNGCSSQLENMLDELPSYQAGFLKDRSCDDHLFTVRRIFDKYWNHEQELYFCFNRSIQSIRQCRYKCPCVEILTKENHFINKIILACINELTCTKWLNLTTEKEKASNKVVQYPLSCST
jgi:hypothetical protein